MRWFAVAFAALALFAAGHAVRGWQDRVALREEAHRADSTLQAVSVRFARERDSLVLLSERELSKATAAEATARRLRSRAAEYIRTDIQKDSVLATVTNAADSLPIVVQQRDGLRLAYDTLALGYDSLAVANTALRVTIQAKDSLARLVATRSEAREAALRALNQSIRLELEHAKNRGKFLGLVRIPGWATFAAGGVAGYLLKP